ncbi:MAG: selenium metabolism protein YedF [Firmicutes bacterium]|nr:selenium metabolism protein YedF [Bacillota bacterium]
MSIKIDARGLACPQPVIAVKKALEKITDGVITIQVDNFAAKENVLKFAAANQCAADFQKQGGIYSITIHKGQGIEKDQTTETATENTVFLITNNTLGHGSEELGAVLIKSFFYALLEKEPLPRLLLFMNSGVYLTSENSPVGEHLQELEQRGVQIFSCGTCLDYFELKDKLVIGGITNMYTIVEEMSAANKVITL